MERESGKKKGRRTRRPFFLLLFYLFINRYQPVWVADWPDGVTLR